MPKLNLIPLIASLLIINNSTISPVVADVGTPPASSFEDDANEDGIPDPIVVSYERNGVCYAKKLSQINKEIRTREKIGPDGKPLKDEKGGTIMEEYEYKWVTFNDTPTECISLPNAIGGVGETEGWVSNVPEYGGEIKIEGSTKTTPVGFLPEKGSFFLSESVIKEFVIPLPEPEVKVGKPGDLPVVGDYSSKECSDLATYNPSTSTYTVRSCDTGQIIYENVGESGDLPVPADYDGDGRTDPATYDPDTSEWSIVESSDGQTISVDFGSEGDIPVPADYDGDGQAELAVYNPDSSTFQIAEPDSPANVESVVLGEVGDSPTAMDVVPSDPGLEPAVYSSESGEVTVSSGGETFQVVIDPPPPQDEFYPSFEQIYSRPEVPLFELSYKPKSFMPNYKIKSMFGLNPLVRSALPVIVQKKMNVLNRIKGDFDGDRKTDLIVSSKSALLGSYWFVRGSKGGVGTYIFGEQGDINVAGDYNGDGITDPAAVRQKGNELEWNMWKSLDVGSIKDIFGIVGDTPIVADFDGDGKTDRAVVREEKGGLRWYFRLSSAQNIQPLIFGKTGDRVLTGDINGDRKAEIITVSTGATADLPLIWNFRDLIQNRELPQLLYGKVGDELLTLTDFNGDNRDDIFVVRNEGDKKVAYIRTNERTELTYRIGAATDIPIPGFYSGVNKAEFAVYRPASKAQGGKLFLRRFNGKAYEIPFGADEESIVRTDGGRIQKVLFNNSGRAETKPVLDKLGCSSYLKVKDGNQGFDWNPGKGKKGKPFLMLTASLSQQGIKSVQLLNSKGKVLQTMKGSKFDKFGRYQLNGKLTASQIAKLGGRPFVLRIKSNNGNLCLKYSNPTKRVN
jgi:hypothetical protein